jgi:uncharacterized protein DUF3563
MPNPPGIHTGPWRNIMIAFVVEKLSNWFESAEQSRREAYLAESADIVQLEQRIRELETNGYSL